METENKNISVPESENSNVNVAVAYRNPLVAWIAVALAVLSWAILMWSNGYVALAVAALGVAVGFFGAHGARPAVRRLAVAAIIASAVLLVVLASFIIVIEVVMG